MKHKLSLFAVLLMALAIPQSVKAYDFSKAYQGQMLYYTIIDSVNHYVKLTCPRDSLIINNYVEYGFRDSLWNVYDRPIGVLSLPDTVSHEGELYTVQSIGSYAFRNCPIFSLEMPNTLEVLEDNAFSNCSYLSYIVFSNNLRRIGYAALAGTNLGDVVLPSSVRELGHAAMSNANITSITLNDSLQSLAYDCLTGNPFTSLFVPASVSSISNRIIYTSGHNVSSIIVDPQNPYYDSRNNCNAIIKSATGELVVACNNTILPEGVTILYGDSFSGCSFNTLVVPSTVYRIEEFECQINKLVISSSAISINDMSNRINSIQILTDTPPILLANVNYEKPIIVPCNSIPAYQAASGWSSFTNYIEDGVHNVTAQQSEHGSVTLVRPTCANPSATFTATADEGYHFAQWSDGDTNNPRIVPIVSDTTLTAVFAINQYTVNAIPNDLGMGTVTGSGMCDHGSTITLTATANSSYHFDHWSDNITENPRTLTVTCDTTVTAYFVALPVDTLYIHDTTIITDTVIFRYYMYDTTIVNNYQYDTSIYNHFQFDTTLVFDTIIINIYNFDTSIYNTYQYDTTIVNYYYYDTVYVNSYTHDTVNNYFYDTINNYYYDTVVITNTYHDTVFVNNYIFDTIYLNRYIFDTIYIHDTVFVPSGQEGIGDVDAIDAKIYQRDGQIVVEGAENNMVWLYDVNGRVLATRQDDYSAIHFDVPASGTYLIKIGNHPARRVVVIK